MPFHRLYCSPNLYTKEEKHEIARAITGVYTKLPPFYVVINFIEVEKDNFFVSGEPEDRFLRIVVGHLAYITEKPEHKRNFMERYEKAIEPFTKSKGIRWEVSITNDDPVFWNENGIQPPPLLSKAFLMWKKLNKAVEWEGLSESEIDRVLEEGDN